MKLVQAWQESSGPRTARDAVVLSLKGVCMGAADIIPGVSGGTIAFITNIYDKLLAAIKSVDATALGRLARLDLAGFISRVHLRFLVFLLLGIGVAVLSMARLMHHLLAHYPVQIWALFFGLIGASIWVVGRRAGACTWLCMAWFAGAAIFSYVLVGLIPMATPEALWFIFLCGSLAICAMILPGISGAYILLLLGKYEYVTGALKAPFSGDNPLILLVFLVGAALGITLFSRLLHWLLSRWHSIAVWTLTGFMLGAMRRIWPWKETLEMREVAGKMIAVRQANVLPDEYGTPFFTALGLMVVGFVFVLVLERLSNHPTD